MHGGGSDGFGESKLSRGEDGFQAYFFDTRTLLSVGGGLQVTREVKTGLACLF